MRMGTQHKRKLGQRLMYQDGGIFSTGQQSEEMLWIRQDLGL